MGVHDELQFGCRPQCVLTAVQETVGIVANETIKASHGDYPAAAPAGR